MEGGEDISILIQDGMKLGKGHTYGEVIIPLMTLKKNEDIEEWYPLRGVKKRQSLQVPTGTESEETSNLSSMLLLKLNYQVQTDEVECQVTDRILLA